MAFFKEYLFAPKVLEMKLCEAPFLVDTIEDKTTL